MCLNRRSAVGDELLLNRIQFSLVHMPSRNVLGAADIDEGEASGKTAVGQDLMPDRGLSNPAEIRCPIGR